MTASARQHPHAGLPLPKPVAESLSCDRDSQLAVASGLSSAPKSNKGEEAATPGQPVAQSAFLEVPPGDSLSRIAGYRQLAAIIRPSQKLSRFAEHTLRHFVARRKSKTSPRCAETVDVETSLWKTEEI